MSYSKCEPSSEVVAIGITICCQGMHHCVLFPLVWLQFPMEEYPKDNIECHFQLICLQKSCTQFLPGQWLDVYIPSLPNHTGGFTITSTPADATENTEQDCVTSKQQRSLSGQRPYLELAIQNAPRNPPAAWLWRREDEILNKPVLVRVGGNFHWPPPVSNIKTAVFVAGGVGIK